MIKGQYVDSNYWCGCECSCTSKIGQLKLLAAVNLLPFYPLHLWNCNKQIDFLF